MVADRPEVAPLHVQVRYLADVLAQNRVAQAVLSVAAKMDLPDWYLAAGGVSQTVWNVRHGFDPAEGIKDDDLVYFDPSADRDAEDTIEGEVTGRLSEFGIELDAKNEAFVHVWCGQRFGTKIEPSLSTVHAISTGPRRHRRVGSDPARMVLWSALPTALLTF